MHIGETSWGAGVLLLIFPLQTFFLALILRSIYSLLEFYSILQTTFHKFHISLSCITHAYKMKICVFKWERGKDTQRTCEVIGPYSSLIASEVTSSLWFCFSSCLHEDWAFSFLFCSVLGAMQKCHFTKAKEKEKEANWNSDYDTFCKLQRNDDPLPQTVSCIFPNPRVLCIAITTRVCSAPVLPRGSLRSVSAAILWDAATRAAQHPSSQQCCPGTTWITQAL